MFTLYVLHTMSSNYKRLITLAEEVFAVKSDPEQLDVDENVIKRLHKIHPSTVSEHVEGDGPVAWLLIIPTSERLMERFLNAEISEKQLFEMTVPGSNYETIYLCSALVLQEYRRKGIIKKLAVKAINTIRKEHPVKALFAWPFTEEGRLAAENLSSLTGLPLFNRTDRH